MTAINAPVYLQISPLTDSVLAARKYRFSISSVVVKRVGIVWTYLLMRVWCVCIGYPASGGAYGVSRQPSVFTRR